MWAGKQGPAGEDVSVQGQAAENDRVLQGSPTAQTLAHGVQGSLLNTKRNRKAASASWEPAQHSQPSLGALLLNINIRTQPNRTKVSL